MSSINRVVSKHSSRRHASRALCAVDIWTVCSGKLCSGCNARTLWTQKHPRGLRGESATAPALRNILVVPAKDLLDLQGHCDDDHHQRR